MLTLTVILLSVVAQSGKIHFPCSDLQLRGKPLPFSPVIPKMGASAQKFIFIPIDYNPKQGDCRRGLDSSFGFWVLASSLEGDKS
jgi:hypothetical protein